MIIKNIPLHFDGSLGELRSGRQSSLPWAVAWRFMYGPQKAHKHKHCYGDIHTLLGFLFTGFIWDIPILVLLMCFFGGPIIGSYKWGMVWASLKGLIGFKF